MPEPDVRERPTRATIAVEALERLAFHALCAVLVLYLNEHLLWAERDARAVFHLFLAAAYLAPLAGRAVAERAGRIRTVRWASALQLAGLAALAAIESRTSLVVGLALVAAGAGAAMPATSALVGERLGAGGPDAAARAGAALRRAVQAASVVAKLGAPLLLVLFGPRAAFAAAAVALGAGVLLARDDRAGLPDAPLAPVRHGFLRVVTTALSRLGTGKPGQDWLEVAREVHPVDAVEGARAVLRLTPVFVALGLFWALFDQRASAWVFQARQLDLSVGGFTLSPAQLQALSPALALVVGPLLVRGVFPLLARKGIAPPPVRKVGAGLFAAAAAFIAAGALQEVIDLGHTPHVAWQAPQYLLLAVGEILVSVTGLELAYADAPRSMRATVMSIGFLTVAAGNLLVVVLGVLRLEGASWYWAWALLGLGAALAFRLTRRGRAAPAAHPAAGAGG